MQRILFIIRKEFLQIFRNRFMVPIIFVVPLVQLIILVNAATLEMKNIRITIVDNDNSSLSRGLSDHIVHSPFFIHVPQKGNNLNQVMRSMEKDKTDVILIFPDRFSRTLHQNRPADLQLLINAINGMKAGIISSYIAQIVRNYLASGVNELAGSSSAQPGIRVQQVSVSPLFWYNPELNYKIFMVPAILVILVTLTGALLAGLNLVREKEIGTIEQINVTPIGKLEFLAGKLIPFLIIALAELAFGLAMGKILFHIPILGSLLLLVGVVVVYLILVQSFSLLISTVSNTQQQAMFLIFFFILIFIMTSGIFTPVESMPELAQKLDWLNPVFYLMKMIRMILLKGSTLLDILPYLLPMSLYAAVMFLIAVRAYRKTA